MQGCVPKSVANKWGTRKNRREGEKKMTEFEVLTTPVVILGLASFVNPSMQAFADANPIVEAQPGTVAPRLPVGH